MKLIEKNLNISTNAADQCLVLADSNNIGEAFLSECAIAPEEILLESFPTSTATNEIANIGRVFTQNYHLGTTKFDMKISIGSDVRSLLFWLRPIDGNWYFIGNNRDKMLIPKRCLPNNNKKVPHADLAWLTCAFILKSCRIPFKNGSREKRIRKAIKKFQYGT